MGKYAREIHMKDIWYLQKSGLPVQKKLAEAF